MPSKVSTKLIKLATYIAQLCLNTILTKTFFFFLKPILEFGKLSAKTLRL